MTTIIKCAFCSGSGKDPFDLLSPLSHCLVCSGTGQVEEAKDSINSEYEEAVSKIMRQPLQLICS